MTDKAKQTKTAKASSNGTAKRGRPKTQIETIPLSPDIIEGFKIAAQRRDEAIKQAKAQYENQVRGVINIIVSQSEIKGEGTLSKDGESIVVKMT